MDIIAKLKNFLVKLQSLQEYQKKIILWTIVSILGVIMLFFWVTGAERDLSKIGDATKGIQIPQLGKQDADALNNIKIPNLSALPSHVTTDTDTSWKTYINNDYSFGIKYPDTLKYSEHKFSSSEINGQVVLGEPGHIVFDLLLAKDPTLKEVDSGISIEVRKRENNIPINQSSMTSYIVEKNGYIYTISLFGSDDSYSDIFSKMIPTFELQQ